MQNNKLLYIHNHSLQSIESGGLNTTLLQVFSMCNAFSKAGYDVTLAMEKDGNFNRNLKVFIDNSFKGNILFSIVHWSKKTNKRFLNRLMVKSEIVRIAEEQNPGLVFTREAYILQALLKSNFLVVFESHNSRLHNRINLIHYYLKNRIISASKHKNFKCLFCISKALANYWEKSGGAKEKLFSWHDGFETSLFKKQISKTEAREKLFLTKGQKIITYTGGLYPDREIDKIILLAKEFPHTYFLVIGGPEKNRQYYEKLAENSNVENIRFVGYVNHSLIPLYMFASDILLALWSTKVPTINYCSPLKLFEYMAAGRVILAHSFPTIKEVLTDQVDAVFCKPGDFDSLKTGLAEAIEASDSNKFGIKARKIALEKYSWDTRARKVLQFISNGQEL